MLRKALLCSLLAIAFASPVVQPYDAYGPQKQQKLSAADTYSAIYRLSDLSNGQAIYADVSSYIYVACSDEADAQSYEANVLIKSQEGTTISLTAASNLYDSNNYKRTPFPPGVVFTIINNNMYPGNYKNPAVIYLVSAVGNTRSFIIDASSTLRNYTLEDNNVGNDYATILSARSNILVSTITGINGVTLLNINAGGLKESQDNGKVMQTVTSGSNPGPYIFLEPAITLNKELAIGYSGWHFYTRYNTPDANGNNQVILGPKQDTLFMSPNALLFTKSSNAVYQYQVRDSTDFKIYMYGDIAGSSQVTISATGPYGDDTKTIRSRYAMNGDKYTITGSLVTITYSRAADDSSFGCFAQIYS